MLVFQWMSVILRLFEHMSSNLSNLYGNRIVRMFISSTVDCQISFLAQTCKLRSIGGQFYRLTWSNTIFFVVACSEEGNMTSVFDYNIASSGCPMWIFGDLWKIIACSLLWVFMFRRAFSRTEWSNTASSSRVPYNRSIVNWTLGIASLILMFFSWISLMPYLDEMEPKWAQSSLNTSIAGDRATKASDHT